MMQEDKELLIRDLCARLPYDVAFNLEGRCIIVESINIDTGGWINEDYPIEKCKPYLFPMSSMTEEQRKEYSEIFHTDWLNNMDKDIFCTYKGVDWLNENHFDYRGLLDKGLAIDATNLNIY